MLLLNCSVFRAVRFGWVPGMAIVGSRPVTSFVLSPLNLGDLQLKKIYFQTTNFFKTTAIAEA
jgi:hypothetical protein